MSVTTKVETIGPARAKAYLEKNTSNRPLRKTRVAKYARAMSSGEWRVTNQGIGFNCDGSLLDGQHRLHAIIEAGVPVRMAVTRGLDRESMFGIDVGATRNVSDIARVAGVNRPITSMMVSTARTMIDGLNVKYSNQASAFTEEQLIEFILTHYEAIDFACSIEFGKISHSAFRAVAARAWYTVDRAELAEFYEILTSGFFKNKGGEWPIKIREFFLSTKGKTGGQGYRRLLYAKTERALKNFLEGNKFTRLFVADEELFRIPGEDAGDPDVAA